MEDSDDDNANAGSLDVDNTAIRHPAGSHAVDPHDAGSPDNSDFELLHTDGEDQGGEDQDGEDQVYEG